MDKNVIIELSFKIFSDKTDEIICNFEPGQEKLLSQLLIGLSTGTLYDLIIKQLSHREDWEKISSLLKVSLGKEIDDEPWMYPSDVFRGGFGI